jgi:hypothetical protein
MSAQHTPGPWYIEDSDYGDEIWLGGEGCGMIVVNGWVNGGCKGDPSEWAKLWVDACLIAAAPDLLAALKGVLPYVEFPNSQFKVEVDAARAAIAKATGQ